MKAENVIKYYTPVKKEFHRGFECEVRDGDTWNKIKCNIIPYGHLTLVDLYRVKYLDKEDIESLGWKHNSYSTFPNGVIEVFKLKHYVFSYYRDEYSTVFEYTILDELRNRRLYLGEIQNKSELKVLMKQLGIDG